MIVSAKSLEAQLEKVRGLEDRLTFRLSVLSRMLDQQAHDMLDGAEINLTSYRILNVVSTFEVISISDLSRFCGIDRAQISRTATDLGKRGFVKFSDDPISKRKKNVSLTETGQQLLDELRPRFLARNLQLDEVLGAERRKALTEAINILTEHAAQ